MGQRRIITNTKHCRPNLPQVCFSHTNRHADSNPTTNPNFSSNTDAYTNTHANGNTNAYTHPTPTPSPTPTHSPTPTPSPNPGFLFTAGFETGSFSEYTGKSGSGTHTETVETGNRYLGAYDAKFTASASSEGWAYQSINASAITYYRQLIKIGTLPTSGRYLFLGSIQYTNSQNTVDPFIYNLNGQYYWGAISYQWGLILGPRSNS